MRRRSALLGEFDVDEHERHVETGQEGLPHHRPGPHHAAPADRRELVLGSVDPHAVHTTSGGIVNVAHCPHRATVRTCRDAASQYGADDSSGTGSGRCVVTG